MTTMKRLMICLAALALTACAAMDAAHIEGQKQDSAKFKEYTDVEYQKQVAVQECFKKASTDNQLSTCALMGVATGMASTFGGRPTATAIAPTTGQVIQGTVSAVAPYAAGASIVKSATAVQAKDPVVVTQPQPLVVRPEVVHPVTITVPSTP